MISFEKINFWTIVSRSISLKAARSKGSQNFWQGGIVSFCSSTYTLYELTLKPSSARFGHGIPEFFLTTSISKEIKNITHFLLLKAPLCQRYECIFAS